MNLNKTNKNNQYHQSKFINHRLRNNPQHLAHHHSIIQTKLIKTV